MLNFLKRQEQTIDQASKDTGQIITGMIISGGYSQTGSRIVVTLIEEDDNSTTVRVAVTEQKRKKLLQTEPWSDPKVNAQKSACLRFPAAAVIRRAPQARRVLLEALLWR
ncbi:MAG: hypothetical protein HY047_07255 [Acidobacteria bacterium]|nr:hypothetical protein [Acidobacteriota bacterium]